MNKCEYCTLSYPSPQMTTCDACERPVCIFCVDSSDGDNVICPDCYDEAFNQADDDWDESEDA